MADFPIPPEFQIKPTQVIIKEGRPDTKTFWPNHLGSQGTAVRSVRDMHRAGMDPVTIPSGHSAASEAAQATMDMAKGIIREHSLSQVDHTRVDEHEGASTVERYEVNRDMQISNVKGVEVSGTPETIAANLRQAGNDPVRPAALTVQQARDVGYSQTEGMTPTTQAAFAQMLAHKGAESIESLPARAITAHVQASTSSGVPMRPELMGEDPASKLMRDQIRRHSLKQNSAPPKPVAQYHPAQSRYHRNDGQIKSTLTSIPAFIPKAAPPMGPSGPGLTVAQTYANAGSGFGALPAISTAKLPSTTLTRAPSTATRFRLLPGAAALTQSSGWAADLARAKKAEQDAAQAAAAAKARAAAAARRAAAAQSDADRSRFQATVSAKGALPHKSTAAAAKAHASQTAASAAAKAAHEEAQKAAMAEQVRQEAAAAAAQEKAAAEQAKRAELAKPKEEAFVQATPDSVADASADSRPPTYGMGTEDSLAVVGDDGLPVYADTYAPGEDKILGISKTTLIVGSAIAVASMGVFFYLNRK